MPPCLPVLLLMMVVVIPGTWTFSCVTPTKDPNAPHLPKLADSSYQAHIELNFVNKNKTWAVEEYLDYVGNRAARIISEGSTIVKYIYSYETDEIFVIKGFDSSTDKTCKVVNMSSPEAAEILFGSGSTPVPGDPNRIHAFGAASTFRLATTNSDFYAGSDTVRGIPANKWSRCIQMGPTAAMETVYYFSTPDWSMPLNLLLPLRIEVEGNIPNRDGTPGTHYFHHIYDFISYRPVLATKPTMFETPTDVVCPGRLNTKPLPSFGNQFQYAAENVDPTKQGVTHFSVWYDGVAKLVRIDKRDIEPQFPIYTTHPVTEIHDHNTGVRYIRDRLLGNCSIHPLSADSADSAVDPDKTIEMSDPSRFFSFNKDYVYTGIRTVRGIQCDVYSAVVHNYKARGLTVNATFHYYFLTGVWQDQPLQGSTGNTRYPVYLEIDVPGQWALKRMVNFFNFDALEPDISVFDVSDCFNDKNKMEFRLIFPGTFDPATEDEWMYYAHYTLADVMKMSPIRIGHLEISYDINNVFLSGSLLGTSSTAQFQLAQSGSRERVLDKIFFDVSLPDKCADLCVKNKDFLCQGFQYCPDDGYSCGLSMYHVLNQTKKTDGKLCDSFTRTVPKYPYPKEPTVTEAYDALEKAVRNRQVHLLIEQPDEFEPNFIAIGVQRLSGYSETSKPMPSITSQFSYRIETVVPKYTTAYDSYVWYDGALKVVRLDTRDASTPNSIEFSNIHDFNLGVSYKIDKITQECMITPISTKDNFDINSFASVTATKGFSKIEMKTPLEIFFMDSSYVYIGQKTVRGIKCDAYQSVRSDFHIKTFNIVMENSVFTIYFQAETWKYFTAESIDVTTTQPVQVTIEDKTAELMMVYNIFDYDDEHHDVHYFDVSTCYNPDQKKSFQIIFKNQAFHPFLDAVAPSFRNTAIVVMGEITSSSPLRFQQVSVSHDSSNVYITATLLGNVPAYTLFQPWKNVTLNSTAKTFSASTYKDCAAACIEYKGYPCDSFYFCPDDKSPQCSLSLKNQPEQSSTSGDAKPERNCIHYSRSELGDYPILDVSTMFNWLTNAVYDSKFSITLIVPGGGNKTYTATDIRDDILLPTDPASAAGSLLRQFSKTVHKKLPKSAVVETHPMTSITDCVLLCKMNKAITCQSFDYDFSIGTCRLSDKHLNEIKTPLSTGADINIYTIFYTNDYKNYGTVLPQKSDKAISQVTSSELCARDCNQETGFKCESFVFCPDQKTCSLRKDHSLPVSQNQPTAQTQTCTFYSREHIYDYTKQSKTVIVGHDDLVTVVDSDSDCARLCANGELKDCASFEVCQVLMGTTQCRLSKADPTLQSSLTKQTTRECNLFIKSNPSKEISKPVIVQKQTTSSGSDTGARVGIAIGTLVLGLLVGAVGMFLFSKWWTARRIGVDDTHQLRDYNNQ